MHRILIPSAIVLLTLSTRLVQASESPGLPVFQGLEEISRRAVSLQEKPVGELFERYMLRPDGRFQSELLIFRDLETGHEIWRLTWDLSRNTPHCHINRSPWNADGSRFVFNSSRRIPGNKNGGSKHMFILDSNGGGMRLLVPMLDGAPYNNLVALARHVVWDRFDPARMYFVDNRAFYLADLVPGRGLVVTTVADIEPPGRRREIFSHVSDNNIVMVKDRGSLDYPARLHFFDMRRNSPDYGKMIHSYPFSMDLDFPDHLKSEEWHLHDITFRRDPEDHYILNYGPFDKPGEPIFWEFPLDGDREKVRLNYAARGGHRPYFSHPAWAAGGDLVAYYGDSDRDAGDYGLHVRDYAGDRHLVRLADSRQVAGGHIAWDGNDRGSLFASPSPRRDTEYSGKIIMAHLDGRPVEVLCTTHTQWQDTTGGRRHDYCSIARPAQSPDGTKCFFSSTMLQPAPGSYDCYVVVARRPHPPVDLSARQVGRGVRLEWTPHELSDEVARYRVYRIRGTNYSFTTLAECPAGTTACPDERLEPGNVYYYAVTSEEHSGLESDRLSPVLEVTVDRDGGMEIRRTLDSGIGWDNLTPEPPSGLTAEKVEAGKYYLQWSRSPSDDIRYYNIYYASDKRPTAGPECLIASLPAGEEAFFDYGARNDSKAHYMVIAVDRQDNLSEPAFYDEP